jgi:histone acetyltransferase (RNA polymerase elongator complex component)
MSARASIIPVFVPHLGCPHACVFCNQWRISGQERPAAAETVREAIRGAEGLLREQERELAFYGGSFTAIPEQRQTELLAAAKEALDAGQIDAIRLSTRPDAIDEAALDRLEAFGVETIELGAQSMDDEVLRRSGRGHTAADVIRASAQVKAAGFRLILQMMTGLPGDSPGRCVESARRIIKCRPDGVRIYPTVIVKDTELYEMWGRGEYREHTVEDAVNICARIVPLFERAGIPVIRLGLNPTEELSGGAAVAGAYHPALGELVRSRILYHEAARLLKGVRPGSRVILEVHPSQVSQMTGQHRENLLALREAFALREIRVKPGACALGEIRILASGANVK